MTDNPLSRRDFLKLSAAGLARIAMSPPKIDFRELTSSATSQFVDISYITENSNHDVFYDYRDSCSTKIVIRADKENVTKILKHPILEKLNSMDESLNIQVFFGSNSLHDNILSAESQIDNESVIVFGRNGFLVGSLNSLGEPKIFTLEEILGKKVKKDSYVDLLNGGVISVNYAEIDSDKYETAFFGFDKIWGGYIEIQAVPDSEYIPNHDLHPNYATSLNGPRYFSFISNNLYLAKLHRKIPNLLELYTKGIESRTMLLPNLDDRMITLRSRGESPLIFILGNFTGYFNLNSKSKSNSEVPDQHTLNFSILQNNFLTEELNLDIDRNKLVDLIGRDIVSIYLTSDTDWLTKYRDFSTPESEVVAVISYLYNGGSFPWIIISKSKDQKSLQLREIFDFKNLIDKAKGNPEFINPRKN